MSFNICIFYLESPEEYFSHLYHFICPVSGQSFELKVSIFHHQTDVFIGTCIRSQNKNA